MLLACWWHVQLGAPLCHVCCHAMQCACAVLPMIMRRPAAGKEVGGRGGGSCGIQGAVVSCSPLPLCLLLLLPRSPVLLASARSLSFLATDCIIITWHVTPDQITGRRSGTTCK